MALMASKPFRKPSRWPVNETRNMRYQLFCLNKLHDVSSTLSAAAKESKHSTSDRTAILTWHSHFLFSSWIFFSIHLGVSLFVGTFPSLSDSGISQGLMWRVFQCGKVESRPVCKPTRTRAPTTVTAVFVLRSPSLHTSYLLLVPAVLSSGTPLLL